jgi:beta-galactosidase beta subunit
MRTVEKITVQPMIRLAIHKLYRRNGDLQLLRKCSGREFSQLTEK